MVTKTKTYKAKISGFQNGAECGQILAIVEQCAGKVVSITYTATNTSGELEAVFNSEDQAQEFDISICDLGLDAEWEE